MLSRNSENSRLFPTNPQDHTMTTIPQKQQATALLSAVTLAALLFAIHTMGETTGAALYLGRVVI